MNTKAGSKGKKEF